MGECDKEYLNGAYEAQMFLKTCPGFESLKCVTKINAKPASQTIYKNQSHRKGLLFSGGSDSTCSLIAHKHENFEPIMIWGLDVPTSWVEFWEKIMYQYRFMDIHKVKTNSEDMYASNKLWSLGAKLTEGYRPTYSFSVNALGVCAPLTCVHGMDLLALSSTYPSRHYGDPRYPWARFRPSFIVNQFWRWGETLCREIDHEYTTAEKIRYFLKPYVEKYGSTFIRSCGNRALLKQTNFMSLNCCLCDKCQRVIGMLIVNGIDPGNVGFPVTGMTYARMRSDIETKKWNPIYLKYHFQEIQKMIPEKIVDDFNGSKAFLTWLRGYKKW